MKDPSEIVCVARVSRPPKIVSLLYHIDGSHYRVIDPELRLFRIESETGLGFDV